MRNSLMPMVLVVVVFAISLLALNSKGNPGLNGPDLHPGIFRLPKKDKFHVDSAALTFDDVVTADGMPLANRGESWRVVLVMAKDRHPLTRSIVLSLGEKLTGHGCVTIIAPMDAPTFPMGVNRIISVATAEAQIPAVLGEAARQRRGHVHCCARVSADHPAAPLLPEAEGSTNAAISIAHHSRATAPVLAWSNWWAGSGRHLAEKILERLAPGGLPAVVDATTRKWLSELTPLSDWGSALAQPPSTDHLKWEFAFQEALVRGWVGAVAGLTITTRSGKEEPTIDQLLKRMKSGSWEAAGTAGFQLFTRKHDNRTEWFSIASRTQGVGWSVVWWQERAGMPDLLSEWATAAKAGDRGAARLLHAHRNCPALPKELQDAARQPIPAISEEAPASGAGK
jgi:hypothetical protein